MILLAYQFLMVLAYTLLMDAQIKEGLGLRSLMM
jgi:hypothetical protein